MASEFFSCLLIHTFLLTSSPATHELEDGFVERAVEVVVRDDKMKICYYVGLNENTRKAIYGNLESGKRKDESLNSRENRSEIPDIDRFVNDNFQRVLLDQLAAGLNVEIDGVRNSMQNRDIEPCPKHHFDFVASYEIRIPPDQDVEISICDHNFLEFDSAARFAFKGLGSTMVTRSNVAPIVIRAQRIDFRKLDEAQKLAQSKIVATVITPPSIIEKGSVPR